LGFVVVVFCFWISNLFSLPAGRQGFLEFRISDFTEVFALFSHELFARRLQ